MLSTSLPTDALLLIRYGGVLGRQEHVANCRQMASHVAKELLGEL